MSIIFLFAVLAVLLFYQYPRIVVSSVRVCLFVGPDCLDVCQHDNFFGAVTFRVVFSLTGSAMCELNQLMYESLEKLHNARGGLAYCATLRT